MRFNKYETGTFNSVKHFYEPTEFILKLVSKIVKKYLENK